MSRSKLKEDPFSCLLSQILKWLTIQQSKQFKSFPRLLDFFFSRKKLPTGAESYVNYSYLDDIHERLRECEGKLKVEKTFYFADDGAKSDEFLWPGKIMIKYGRQKKWLTSGKFPNPSRLLSDEMEARVDDVSLSV